MKKTLLLQTMIAAILTILAGTSGVVGQNTQRGGSNSQIRTVLTRIQTGAATLKRSIDVNSQYGAATNAEERVSDQLTALTTAANTVRSSMYTRSYDATGDVNEILERAGRINRILTRNGTSSRISTQWTSLRTDINTLAGYYGLSRDWNESYGTGNGGGTGGYGSGGGRFNSRLTGTYRLNASLSDDVSAAIDRAVRNSANDQGDRLRRTLERRLASPEMIALDKNGRTISMASSNRPQVTFDADGVAHTETNARGRAITTTVTATNNSMTINYTGDRSSDFNVTFAADRDGRLKVTRRIYLEGRNDAVSVSSVYDKTNDVAEWSSIDSTPAGGPSTGGNYPAGIEYYVPNGMSLTATLRDPINTRASQSGDRFTMDVTSPDQYRGAVIEGRVSQAASSGRVTGRARIQLDMDTITVNRRQYQFAGIIDSVTAANGDTVTVNNEGTIRDTSQTNKTVTRTGIGAVLGAVIGAIAGGGEGAAIGAGVGAGVGAGSVLATGRDAIELGTGSTFRITSTAPANGGYVRKP